MSYVTKSWVKIQFDNFANRITSVFARKADIPSKTSDLENDSGFVAAESPTFTGTPKAPTAAAGTNSAQISTTAFVNTAVSSHNSSSTAHDDIRTLITGLTNRLNALADSDDTTLDQLSEIVAYIKSNRSLIDSITTSKVSVSDIIDNLTSTATNKPLSAKQGEVLKGLIDVLTAAVENKVDKVSGKGLSTNDYTTAEKTKLAGIADNANNYSLPAASSTVRGGVKTGYTANGKNYPVQLSNEQMYVNVPWEVPDSLPANGGTAETITETLPISKGGTGETTAKEGLKALIGGLALATAAPTDDDWYLAKSANSGDETPVRRKITALWEYIKTKINDNGISGIKFKSTNKPDNSGKPAYLLLYDITTWYNSTTTGQAANLFYGLVFSARAEGHLVGHIERVYAGVSYQKSTVENASLFVLRTTGTGYAPCVIKNDTNSKYYLALRVTGSYRSITLLGKFTGTYLGTWVSGTDASWTISGYTVVNKDYKLYGASDILTSNIVQLNAAPVKGYIDLLNYKTTDGRKVRLGNGIEYTAPTNDTNYATGQRWQKADGETAEALFYYSNIDNMFHLSKSIYSDNLGQLALNTLFVDNSLSTEHAQITFKTGHQSASISSVTGYLRFAGASNVFEFKIPSGSGHVYYQFGIGDFHPFPDSTISLGEPTARWKQLYAITTTISTSDRNMKKDFAPISDKYIELLMKLEPVSFMFKDNTSGRTHVGFIAQDVEAAMEEVGLTSLDFAGFCRDVKTKEVRKEVPDYDENGNIVYDKDGNPVTHEVTELENVYDEDGNLEYIYSLRYSEFIALNTAAIQRQQEKINSLESRMAAIEEMFGIQTQIDGEY